MDDVVPQEDNPPAVDRETNKPARTLYRILGVGLIVTAVVIAWLLIVGFLGYQSGQRKLAENQAAELRAAVDRQLQLAREDVAQGNRALAASRLEWVLARDPGNQAAQALWQQTQTNPVSTAGAPEGTATPTAVPLPTATPGRIADPASELQRLRRLTASKAWEEALPALIAFQRQFPDYERMETDRMLYNAYLEYGVDLIMGDSVETGLFYLAQAEKLGDLPQSALDYRLWATLYTQGISYYGVNWDLTAYFFRDLCLAAPFFHNACDILYESLVNVGDLYAANLDWCPAAQYYEEASFQQLPAELEEKLAQAREGCAQATPTPPAPITDTLDITGTAPITSPLIMPPPTPTPGS